MDLVDTVTNLIRTPYDLLHVLFYISLATIAFVISLYIGNREEFDNYIYNPYLKSIHDKLRLLTTLLKIYFLIFWVFMPRNVKWTPISNRLLYFSKIIKNIFNNLFK